MKRERRPLRKVTLSLFDGDIERLRELYPQVGVNKLIREMIAGHIAKVEAVAGLPSEAEAVAMEVEHDRI